MADKDVTSRLNFRLLQRVQHLIDVARDRTAAVYAELALMNWRLPLVETFSDKQIVSTLWRQFSERHFNQRNYLQQIERARRKFSITTLPADEDVTR